MADARPFAPDPADLHPPLDSAAYRGAELRAPRQPLRIAPATLAELDGPVYGEDRVAPGDADLTGQHSGEPLGDRKSVV